MLIHYRTFDKAMPPRKTRLEVGGWAGTTVKMVDGSEAQPWHCMPFVEGATYGLELLYQYDTECHVVNNNGKVQFDWDFSRETNSQVTGGEFVTTFPKEKPPFYMFTTALDIKAPPGYVMRTSPHPRFFTDETGTVPPALVGHLQSEWWAKQQFVVFKSPAPGQRHIFRKGEPYVQLLFVPQQASYEIQRMAPAEETSRMELERSIATLSGSIGKHEWKNPAGFAFNDHYKVMARAYARNGMQGVLETVSDASQRQAASMPATAAECLDLGLKRQNEGRPQEARRFYRHAIDLEPENAEAISRLGIVAAQMEMPMLALELMQRAVQIKPDWPPFLGNLGELLRRLNRVADAVAVLTRAVQLQPGDSQLMSNLGLAMAQQGRLGDGLRVCQAATALAPPSPIPFFRTGLILREMGQIEQARASFEKALEISPGFMDARQHLDALPPRRG